MDGRPFHLMSQAVLLSLETQAFCGRRGPLKDELSFKVYLRGLKKVGIVECED